MVLNSPRHSLFWLLYGPWLSLTSLAWGFPHVADGPGPHFSSACGPQPLPEPCHRWPFWIVSISWGHPCPDSTHPSDFIRRSLDRRWDLPLSLAQSCSGAMGWFLLSKVMASAGVTCSSQLVLLSLLPAGLAFSWPKARWFHRVFCAHWYYLSGSAKLSGPQAEILVRTSSWLWAARHRFCLLLHGSLILASF